MRWQPGSRTQFINVTTVATAAQSLGQQCGGSRDCDATVLWQQDSWGSGDAAAAPAVQRQLGIGLTAQRCMGTAAQKPTGSCRFIPPPPQCWPSWHL